MKIAKKCLIAYLALFLLLVAGVRFPLSHMGRETAVGIN